MKFVFFKHVKDAVQKRKKVLILAGMAMLLGGVTAIGI